MQTLPDYLAAAGVRAPERALFVACADAARRVNALIRMQDTVKDRAQNASGDTQSALDLAAHAVFADALRATRIVRTIASEEAARVEHVRSARDTYCVAFDPYDGGSVGDANVTFGSIIGFWRRSPLGAPRIGRGLLGACAVLYGPRVTVLLAHKRCGVALFELDEAGDFRRVRDALRVAPHARHIAPGNLAAAAEDERYRALLDDLFFTQRLKLRYSGALVTDINHIVLKGDGLFLYPAGTAHPAGRLRLFYEGAPLAFLLACAGGDARTHRGTRLLELPLRTAHQRATFVMGSRASVAVAVRVLRH